MEMVHCPSGNTNDFLPFFWRFWLCSGSANSQKPGSLDQEIGV